MPNINRRSFIQTSGAFLAASSALSSCTQSESKVRQPNIILIITDQQSAGMMSCAGNRYLNTPALDRLAATGVTFSRAYCTAPVCVPSRFSLMTGRMPSEIGLRDNNYEHIGNIPEHILEHGLGHAFKNAGYDAAYGGKVHLPKMDAIDLGFDYISDNERDELADTCATYIQEEREKPFFLVASLINPHDICYMAIRDFAESEFSKYLIKNGVVEVATLDKALQTPPDISDEEFFDDICPPVPENFEPQKDEPEAVRELLAQRPFRMKARERWSEKRWRQHRWAYHRLTEMVDSQIGVMLDALERSGKAAETVVIFTSDHGDMDSAHRMEHKTAFYEEASHIPLIVSQQDTTAAGTVDTETLVSNGLDLYPTLCDYAGIDVPGDLRGIRFRPVAEGREREQSRDYIPVENEIGYMIVTGEYKYALHDRGENREQLYDLTNDPGETRNALHDSDKQDIVKKHRALFQKEFSELRHSG